MTATIEELSEKFYVTYFATDDTLAAGEWMIEHLNKEVVESTLLDRVVLLCEIYDLDADLADSNGNKRGWVHSTGRYQVGDGQ